jgi:hypothetical protein
MFVVANLRGLNWWLRNFAPRVVLRIALEVIEASSGEQLVRARTTLAVEADGDRRILGIGDDPVADASVVRISIFEFMPGVLRAHDDLVEPFLRVLLKRLPRSPGFIRPVVIVEGLGSLHERLAGREREVIVRALTGYGAVAAVISDR